MCYLKWLGLEVFLISESFDWDSCTDFIKLSIPNLESKIYYAPKCKSFLLVISELKRSWILCFSLGMLNPHIKCDKKEPNRF